ncbi:uncharacterized protein TRAVEDRAFT_44362 [Trametes versicolor FP-101664 SS1]|uniref:uncharacterized protein n=1 Tax=Trametes versicolor (strain FP-101664) TaxID=717944 RepID=UPI000462216D|nr:uncharacterized protein TRAVEDRAFT_44362 [Trametes versicolor FP-101664 SS1]EIW61542.1 hypothetical protein TRAVEDRAFT_44362 [Trametes versicolor FP-101664 SS1]
MKFELALLFSVLLAWSATAIPVNSNRIVTPRQCSDVELDIPVNAEEGVDGAVPGAGVPMRRCTGANF